MYNAMCVCMWGVTIPSCLGASSCHAEKAAQQMLKDFPLEAEDAEQLAYLCYADRECVHRGPAERGSFDHTPCYHTYEDEHTFSPHTLTTPTHTYIHTNPHLPPPCVQIYTEPIDASSNI